MAAKNAKTVISTLVEEEFNQLKDDCRGENDIFTLLHSDSYHPENCKMGIIYSQVLRYRRIITNDSDIENHLYNL